MKGKLVLTVKEAEADHSKWEDLRKTGIGGSDVASIVGMDPWKSAYALWVEKTGQVEAEDLSENERVHFGNVLEQVVADEFCLRTGKKVRKCGTLQDEEYPFILANIDRWVEGENAGLECKTANGFSDAKWEGDEVPTKYYLQCQFYMMVTGAEKWYIACLIGGNHFVWKEIPRNDDDIKALREATVKFWTENIQGGAAPELDGLDSTMDLIKTQHPVDNGKFKFLPSSALPLIEQFEQVRDTKKIVEEQEKKLKAQFAQIIGDSKGGIINGKKVTWGWQKGGVKINTDKLKEMYPDVYAKVATPGSGFRVLRTGKATGKEEME